MFENLQQVERFLFFTGKGGVGKTSLACAASIALADIGRRVLLISTDPASNLDEVLETKLSSQPTKVTGVPGLKAMNINPAEAAEAYRERIVGPYRGILPESAVANIEEQLSGACTMEIASFNEFSRLIGEPNAVREYDHVILDTAPTGHTLRLFNLPSAWSDFIADNKTGSSCLGPLSGLQEQKGTYDRAVQTLKDGEQTALVLVARSDSSSLQEAAKAGDELRTLGLANQRLMINAVFLASRADDPLANELQLTGEAARANMPASLCELPRIEIPFSPSGAVGLGRIRAIAQRKPPEMFLSQMSEDQLHQTTNDLDTLVNEAALKGHGVIMTMGKGGVGKTTIATEIALKLANLGHSVLLATTDPADHITSQFDVLPDRLTVEAIDPKRETERHVREVMATTGASLDTEARALLKEELGSPCIEEIAVFTAFARAVAKGSRQFVVLDTAPTGHTLLLLDTTEAYHREVERNSELSPDVRELLPRLRDQEYTRVMIVTLPEATPVHEAAYLQDDLRRAGIEPWAWIINRSLHGLESIDPLIVAKRNYELPYISEVLDIHSKRSALVTYQSEALTNMP